MKRIDAGLMARVQHLLDARANLPRAQIEGRPKLQVTVEGDTTDLLIYDEIGWFGVNAQDVVDVLDGVKGDLHVRVNSPGGDVFDGVAIYNALLNHDGHVTVTVDALAASAASFIAMAGDEVVMSHASQMMIHDASGLCIGNAADMAEMVDLLNRVSGMIAGIYAARSGGDVDEWRGRMQSESWYSAEEAVSAGLADEAASPPPRRRRGEDGEADAQVAARWDLSAFHHAGRSAAPSPSVPAPAAGPVRVEFTVDNTASDDELLAAVRKMIRDRAGAPATAPPNPDGDGTPEVVGTAVGPHGGTAKEGTWDGPAQERKLPSPMPVATAKAMYGWYDSSQVEDGKLPKSACKLPHHEVSEDGTPGAAVLNGVRNALSRLPQTQGLSDAERSTIERHLRGHLPKGADDNADDLTGQATTDPPEPEPDDWHAATAHLTAPEPSRADTWTATVAHLTTTSEPSSAATDA